MLLLEVVTFPLDVRLFSVVRHAQHFLVYQAMLMAGKKIERIKVLEEIKHNCSSNYLSMQAKMLNYKILKFILIKPALFKIFNA